MDNIGTWIVNGDVEDKYFPVSSKCSICRADESKFICGTEIYYGYGKSHYCPNCGAKMGRIGAYEGVSIYNDEV